jgi:TM2 domain-containing membrane protein YozV
LCPPPAAAWALTIFVLALTAGLAAASGSVPRGSVLALPLVTGSTRPELLLAQRTIERKWGPSDDSTYREVNVPGWKSEGGAMAFSFVIPGAGQMYAGERSGLFFLLGEAIGIYQVFALMNSADDWDKKARTFAGNPNDSTSTWSFESYQQRTGSSTSDLQALYAADPSLFYYRIGADPSLAPGWVDYSSGLESRSTFTSWRDNAESRRHRSHMWRSALWINHLGAAVDAFRVARLANVPLRDNLHMHLKTDWSSDGPAMSAVIEARF